MTGHEEIKYQLQMIGNFGRKGDMESARLCLNSAKTILETLKDVDESLKANLDSGWYKKNFDHFDKMIG